MVAVWPGVKDPWADSIMLDLLGEIKPKDVRKERAIFCGEGIAG